MFVHQRVSSVNVFLSLNFKHHQSKCNYTFWSCHLLCHFHCKSRRKIIWFHPRSTCPFYLLQHWCGWCLCLFEWQAGGWDWREWWVEAAECQGLLPRRHSRWAAKKIWMTNSLSFLWTWELYILKAWLDHCNIIAYHCSVSHYHHCDMIDW